MTNVSEEAQEVSQLYEYIYKDMPKVERLPGAGSDRSYFRLRGPLGESVIATYGNDVRENLVFCDLANAFRKHGCAVPEILAVGDSGKVYLQEDLGDIQLLDLLFSDSRMELAKKSLAALANIQLVPQEVWQDLVGWAPFNRRLVMWDLNYFKYEFLKPAVISFDEDRLENDFEKFTSDLCNNDELLTGFMYRDFQSRNIMVKDGECRLIDFQGGRKGPLLYDAVSFLWQAKAGFTAGEREELLRFYAGLISKGRGVAPKAVLKDVDKFALFRTLQVLGAYGFRGLVEKKSHFIESIPGALDNLKELIDKNSLRAYPELEKAAKACVASRFAGKEKKMGLTLKVFSFSYKRGYPEDLTGNGGGFMFDCRGMHNPGRYECYKKLTGLDKEVIEFLEEKGEVQGFVSMAIDMVAPTVERYLSRGFTSLQVGFGCTGGRHRSVYCAQRFVEKILERFPDLTVELLHREQGQGRVYNIDMNRK